MDVDPAFVADAQPPELVKPTDRPFDDPTDLAQSAAVFAAAFGDHRLGADLTQRGAVRFTIVRAVGVQRIEAVARRARLAADRGHGVDQVQQLGHVVAVGGGGYGDDRDAVAVGEHVVF